GPLFAGEGTRTRAARLRSADHSAAIWPVQTSRIAAATPGGRHGRQQHPILFRADRFRSVARGASLNARRLLRRLAAWVAIAVLAAAALFALAVAWPEPVLEVPQPGAFALRGVTIVD